MFETLSKIDQIINEIKKTATISDEEKTRKKLNKIIKDGFDSLHVISGKMTVLYFSE